MKKILLFIALVVFLLAAITGWKVFGPTVNQPDGKYFYIHTGAVYAQVRDSLIKNKIISGKFWFDRISKQLDYPGMVKPGRYLIGKDMSLINLVRMLRNGRQEPVNFILSRRIRTMEDLAKLTSGKFEFDSASMMGFLKSDTLSELYGLDSTSYLTAILPDTYTLYWNSVPQTLFDKLYNESRKFWTDERKQKAKDLGLTPGQVYTLASIVEEETRYAPDKPRIASVYLNRLAKNMPLEADPTAKFALRDFGLTRIYYSHLKVESPYNTYKNKGLPPGPICSVQRATIDSVLNAPETDYIFFVADSDFSGKSVFTSNYKDHQIYAKAFAKAQDSVAKLRQQRTDNTDK